MFHSFPSPCGRNTFWRSSDRSAEVKQQRDRNNNESAAEDASRPNRSRRPCWGFLQLFPTGAKRGYIDDFWTSVACFERTADRESPWIRMVMREGNVSFFVTTNRRRQRGEGGGRIEAWDEAR